jgi:hypothetical protein
VTAAQLAATGDARLIGSYAKLARQRGPARLVGPVLRTRSQAARSIFAHLASGGQSTYDDLMKALAAENSVPTATAGNVYRRRWLLGLATVLAAQAHHPQDPLMALRIFDGVFDHAEGSSLDKNQQMLYAQLLFLHGEHKRAEQILPCLRKLPALVANYLRCDLANPFARAQATDWDVWLAHLNAPLVRTGLEPLLLTESSAAPFDRIGTRCASAVANGELVSVIMTAYRPDESMVTAVRSVLAQTWADLELIIVDDGSGKAYQERFAECAALDERVTVIHQRVNTGTYVARNAGLDRARGMFVTFQDSDDWSHPRRLERQLEPLLEDPGSMATRSVAVRARDDLTHQWLGYPPQRLNASSLMFRKHPVVSTIGYFDSVRKSADLEHAFRLEAAFDHHIHNVNQALAYTRLRTDSLSRADFTFGWSAPARIAYQAAYQHWHGTITRGADPYLPRIPDRRPFPAPASFLRGVPGAPRPRRRYDVLLLDDLLSHGAPLDGLLEDVAALKGIGITVGLVHLEAIGRMSPKRKHVAHEVQHLINTGAVDRVALDDDVRAPLLVVRDPLVLQYPPAARAGLRVNRALVVVPRPPAAYPWMSVAYQVETCRESVENLLGATPSWAASHASLRALLPTDAILRGGSVIPPPVDLAAWTGRRVRRPGDRPVIGRCGADGPRAWPQTRDALLQAYPDTGEADVRILGAADSALTIAEHDDTPPSWTVHRDGELSLREFLHQIDFFVYVPSAAMKFPPLDTLARAMASGAVVILPHRFQEYFGDAAVYSSPEDVLATVHHYQGHPDLYRAQVNRGRAFVRDHHAPGRYARSIARTVRSVTPARRALSATIARTMGTRRR